MIKNVLLVLVVMIGLSACASKKVDHNGSYERAHAASDTAQRELR